MSNPENGSQNGEDEIVAACFPADYKGTVLEVGAWMPTTFSNSRIFIERGWDATLIEFSPLAVERQLREYGYHERVRIIQAAVVPSPRHVERFQVTEDALSSSDDAQCAKWKDMRPGYSGGYYGYLWVPTLSLGALLEQFYGDKQLDFVSIDTEGASAELAIALLKTDHRPKVLCCEHDNRVPEIMGLARPMGYVIIEHNQENCILRRDWR